MAYNSAYTGSQVDAAVGAVRQKETIWDGKQDELTGTEDQLVGFNSAGEAVAVEKPTAADVGAMPAVTGGTAGQVLTKTEAGQEWQNPPDTGVTTFNGRTGAVTPQAGDYTAEMVGARPSTWTPTASDVGAVPTTRTINSKPLSSNVTLTADDVGAGAPATSTTVTLTASGWTGSAAPFSQQVSCSIVAADTAVVAVDVDTPGTDADADAEAINAWALCTQQNPTQGAGTLTFYCTEKPTINIPVKVGVA